MDEEKGIKKKGEYKRGECSEVNNKEDETRERDREGEIVSRYKKNKEKKIRRSRNRNKTRGGEKQAGQEVWNLRGKKS